MAGAAIATVFFSRSIGSALLLQMKRFEILRTTPAERNVGTDADVYRSAYGIAVSITAIGSIMLQSANNALVRHVAALRLPCVSRCSLCVPSRAWVWRWPLIADKTTVQASPDVWQGVKASALMMIVYWAFTFAVLMVWSQNVYSIVCRGFGSGNSERCGAFSCIYLSLSSRYLVCFVFCVIQFREWDYTNLAMLFGVSEMIARILISLLAVPACSLEYRCLLLRPGSPDLQIYSSFPLFAYVYRHIPVNEQKN